MAVDSAQRVAGTASELVPTRGTRADIQALRAVAVTLVVVYHVWPSSLSGGFVGVDVFFVISGFLITSHLLRRPPRTGRDLAVFWSRRIRRLLPASLLVLTCTLVASRLVAPETQWENTARQAGAAALYLANWLLASDSVDYLAAENAATPVQHFWSLSVEEQFYAFWPVLLLLLTALAVRLRARQLAPKVLPVGLGGVVLVSFAWSVYATATEPASAYFVTPTRVWELGVGALVAVAVGRARTGRLIRSASLRVVIAFVGLAIVVVVAMVYTRETPFPGWYAAVPVLATALVIVADAPVGSTLGSALANRPVQWLGGISYSVYLWHWPLVVLVPYATGARELNALTAVIVVLTTLVLADLTKRYVEDRFRGDRKGTSLRTTYLMAVIGMVAVVGLAAAQVAEVDRRQSSSEAALARAMASDPACFGAAALDDPERCGRTTSTPVVPTPAAAAEDKSNAYAKVSGGKDCWSYLPDFPVVTCTFGERDADVSVALVGNSHAGQWLPALEEIAAARGWRITTYLASRCAYADVNQRFDTESQSRRCREWGKKVTDRLAAGYDLVVMSNRMSAGLANTEDDDAPAAYREGYAAVLRQISRSGAPTVVVRDTPAPGRSIPDCLAASPDDFRVCEGKRSDWLPEEPAVDAASEIGTASVADLTDHICRDEVCEAAVGGVPVYFDGSHLTATYARTLAPYLDPVLVAALAQGRAD
ncbi:acyltransferase [Mumia sp. zg.B17]|uniref:acyltransferase family protein n=1 Tax=Mumia sp. zg.B17 TaxID=2855446 RepID=UPI001C6EF4F5|nr:acyltransferase family protein [Mumia sp. zg.B17]MBW9204494.1 acyltransferase [Mumia sp. zg.B17]